MRVAIASGKGGTGKTTLAVCLAHALGERGERVTYVDCDVEEPNGHIFLKPTFEESAPVELLVPSDHAEGCTACGRCTEFCEFNAIVNVRFTTSAVTQGAAELYAYGTAVVIE